MPNMAVCLRRPFQGTIIMIVIKIMITITMIIVIIVIIILFRPGGLFWYF